MNNDLFTKPLGLKYLFSSFWNKHGAYFSIIYKITLYIGFFYAFIKWLRLVFDSIRYGDFLSFLGAIILQSIIMGFNALLFTAVWGTIIALVLFIPYLIIRGFSK